MTHADDRAKEPRSDVDVLIVGAGPTGLALAAQLRWSGTRFRIIDRSLDRARESRALAVQARTLEILDALGLADPLVARGSTSTRLVLHFGPRQAARLQRGRVEDVDTRFPFILFVSQAETERVLGEHLSNGGVTIERGAELVDCAAHDGHVVCLIRGPDGQEERLRARYLAGCDGAHSMVRKQAGFAFQGGTYPQDFVLGDVEADGPLEARAINSFVGGGGTAMFFPLGAPATWRVIAMAGGDTAPRSADGNAITTDLSLAELQAIVDPPTRGVVRLRDPAWLTRFHLHHRQTSHYRAGRIFLAGDAAHIHSPVGAQGMNTGIQDAWNLGWKLALVLRGAARESLLDSYESERWEVGHFLLRYTDRIFSTFTRAMSGGWFVTWVRKAVLARVVPRIVRRGWLQRAAFRFVSELGIRYRRSPAVQEGEPRLGTGPRAGDRLPDARVTVDGRSSWLQREVIGPHLSLVLCGDRTRWNDRLPEGLTGRLTGGTDVVAPHYLTSTAAPGALVDADGHVLRMLGASDGAQYLIRPDGHIAFRCAGHDLSAVEAYLKEWLPDLAKPC